MMHTRRRWGVGPLLCAEDLAHKLTERTWTLCTGFFVASHEDYLFLNDATHEDGAAEHAIVKGRNGATEHVQIESITFSWCSYHEALAYIRTALAGEMDVSDFARPVQPRLEPIDKHGACHLCA